MPENTATHELPQQVSKAGKTKISFVLFLVIIYPFINIFGYLGFVSPVFEDFSIYSYMNYFSFIFATYVLLNEKKIKFSKHALMLSGFLVVMLGFNYVVTPLASIKWLINWLGFIYISLVLVQLIKNFTKFELLLLQTKFLKWMRSLLVMLSIAMAITHLANFEFLIDNLATFAGDQISSIATYSLGIDKQALGSLYQILFVSIIIFWSKLKNKDRTLFVIMFVTLIPTVMFIRTFLLSMFLVFIYLYLTKSALRKIVMFFCLLLFVVGVIVSTDIINFVQNNYDRLPSLKFAWSAMTENIFGLGNGGYHIYVEKHNSEIVALFGSEKMIEINGFWGAPESDLVYFIASWGILSVFFFLYFVYVLIKGVDLFHNNKKLLPIEKAMLLMMFSFIFSGISQDNAGSLVWWVYMAAGSGVVLRQLRESKSVVPMQQRQAFN